MRESAGNALELAKRAVDLERVGEVLGGLRFETVDTKSANEGRMGAVERMSSKQRR